MKDFNLKIILIFSHLSGIWLLFWSIANPLLVEYVAYQKRIEMIAVSANIE